MTYPKDEPFLPVTADQLAAVAARLPPHTPVFIEDKWGQKFQLVHAIAVGLKTDDPCLALRITDENGDY